MNDKEELKEFLTEILQMKTYEDISKKLLEYSDMKCKDLIDATNKYEEDPEVKVLLEQAREHIKTFKK